MGKYDLAIRLGKKLLYNTVKTSEAKARQLGSLFLCHENAAVGRTSKVGHRSTVEHLLNTQKREQVRKSLQQGKKIISDKKMNIPTGKNRAPGVLFEETDKAFQCILTKNKFDVLYMHQRYKVTGDLDDFIENMYYHYVNKTDIDQFAPKLNIKSNIKGLGGSFDSAENIVNINKGCISNEGSVANTIAHELNHWFQNKEQLITTSEGPELVAYNRVRARIRELVENGTITTQEQCDEIFNDMYQRYAQKYRTTYKDLINSNKYQHNDNPTSQYFQKANKYNEADMNYKCADCDDYWNSFKEIESYRRGDVAEETYNRIINIDLAKENNTLDIIMSRIGNGCEKQEKLALLEIAIDYLKNPKFQNMSSESFANWFLSKFCHL